jgi:hypothetical protein
LKVSDESNKKLLKIVKENLKKPEKAKTFVWEPIEGFNQGPIFLTWTPSMRRGAKSVQ